MNSKKLKGFTLVEMIVVIAIITALAGIVSMSIQGFQRNARMETNNNKAQMAYTGFQNMLIQCEINQDDSLLSMDKIKSSPAYSSEPLTYATVEFAIGNGEISGNFNVKSVYGNTSSKKVSETLLYNSADDENKKAYQKLEKAILSNLDVTAEGHYYVSLDFENYTVDSVCYFESADDVSAISSLDYFGWASDANSKGKVFPSLVNMDDQTTIIKVDGKYVGIYPFMRNFDSYAVFA